MFVFISKVLSINSVSGKRESFFCGNILKIIQEDAILLLDF